VVPILKGEQWTGRFGIPGGTSVYGQLSVSRANTLLSLHDEDDVNSHATSSYLVGTLLDQTKVSLIGCIPKSLSGLDAPRDGEYQFATVFPHFVVHGNKHIAPNEKTIRAGELVMDDATTLFYDFDAFSSLLDARPFIEQISKANALPRTVATGPHPQILYFTGKTEIFSAETVWGTISAFHQPSRTFGGPAGVALRNTIVVTIRFIEPVLFDQSILHISALLRYFGMLVGRPQNILKLSLLTEDDQENLSPLQVYWSMSPAREPILDEQKPHPADVLVDPIRQPEEFSRVLANWVERQDAWRDARFRFSNSFSEQNCYGLDRLIGSANMFDILPGSAVPAGVELSEELEAVKLSSRTSFLSLPQSPERDSILNALGRIGKASLKRKIRYRAQAIVSDVGACFPELLRVTDEAVNCRNYYVHGGDARFDYDANVDTVNFFTDALEFVFAASDLIEAGWDIKRWTNSASSMSHPFGRFRINYAANLQQLTDLLPPRVT
jgi:ApeA N-terminal domain 1